MSYFGTREQAKADCKAADLQIDGNDASSTSPVRDGSDSAGSAPMEGEKNFTKARTRPGWKGNQGGMRREFPTEGVTK
jgi:hypothetical protein